METGFLIPRIWTRFASPAKSTRQTGKSDWLRHAANLCGRVIFLLIFLASEAYAVPPTADAQTVITTEDNAVAITLTGSDLDGDNLTFEIVNGPSDGNLSGGPPNVTYTPDPNFNGSDSFSFVVNDGFVNSNNATVSINVISINDPPEVVTPIPDQTATEDEFFSLNVSGNFTDVDDNLRFSATGLPGSLSIGSNSGLISGTPTQAESEANGGVYTVTVFATDNDAPAVESSFTLRVIPSNDAPVADSQNTSMDEDGPPIGIVLTGSDLDGDNLTFEIVNGPSDGSLSGTAPNVTYTPDPNFNGSDSFSFVVNDGFVNSNNANVSITVISINDPPILDQGIADSQAVEATPFNLNISGNFSDVDGPSLNFSADGHPSGNISFNQNTGVFSGTPDFDDARDFPYQVRVTATDGEFSVSDIFLLTIAALDRANVSLDVTTAPDPAMLGDEVQFNFTVHNGGPTAATGIALSGSFVGDGLIVTPSGATTCTVQAPANQVADFSCIIGDLLVGAFTSLGIAASTGSPGAVTLFATAAVAAAIPIDPNIEDNSVQRAVGVAELFSNGAVQILGNAQVLSVAVGDVDGDGAADLVVGTEAGQPVQIYLSGGFREFNTVPISGPDNSAHQGVALAHFNNDGFLDMVLANAGVPDRVYSNDGNGNFSLLAELPGATLSNDVAVADFNRDGSMDIVFAVTGDNLVYLGDGAGGFALHDTLGSADSRGVAVGRVDGNNRTDVVFANVGSASRLWIKNSGARFSSKQTYTIGDASSVVIAELIGSDDANALDIAFGRIPTSLGDIPANPVIRNDGSGNLSVSLVLGAAPTNDILAGDVNRDALIDLVFVNASGVHQIWTRTGNSFELHREQIFADNATSGVVADLGMTDVDDPGGVDLVIGSNIASGAGVFLNDGFGNLGRGDAVAPEMTLRGNDPFNVPAGSTFVDPGVTATDNIDGDISSSVIATGNVNSAVVGTYSVTYDVIDFAGNSATPMTRTVIITVAAGTGGGGGGAIAPLTVLFALAVLIAALWRRHRYIARVRYNKNLLERMSALGR